MLTGHESQLISNLRFLSHLSSSLLIFQGAPGHSLCFEAGFSLQQPLQPFPRHIQLAVKQTRAPSLRSGLANPSRHNFFSSTGRGMVFALARSHRLAFPIPTYEACRWWIRPLHPAALNQQHCALQVIPNSVTEWRAIYSAGASAQDTQPPPPHLPYDTAYIPCRPRRARMGVNRTVRSQKNNLKP
ncbi:hypothetical protein BDV09DRAFT_107034 [Aspergillus tetrazonus]